MPGPGTSRPLVSPRSLLHRAERKECLNDALIYLTAAKRGLPVVTVNRAELT